MQKTLLILIIVIVLVAVVVGVFYFLGNKVEKTPVPEKTEKTKDTVVLEDDEPEALPPSEQVSELGNLAPEVNLGAAAENPLQDMPVTNPLQDVPNPFKNGYENPFE